MGEASVFLHLVVENHFEHKLIRHKPALFQQNIIGILNLRTETKVFEIRTYVVLGSSGNQTATRKQIAVESTRKIVEIDVPAGAGIGKWVVEESRKVYVFRGFARN